MDANDRGSVQEPNTHSTYMRALTKDELRSLVSEWTLVLREERFPPEKALVTVKTLVREGIAPHISHYDGSELAEDRTALIGDAVQCCIQQYFNGAQARSGRGRASSGCNTAARKSLSRKLLLKLLVLRPHGLGATLASELSIGVRQLAAFASGTQLMPIHVQARLATLVIDQHPELARLARRLRHQAEAARRFQDGDVIRHAVSPPARWR
jgi:hypothetical protein